MMKLVRVAIVVLELYALGTAALFAFLMVAWMEHDSFAYSASELDWWIEAGKRFIVTALLSVAVSIIVWFVNRPLLRWAGFTNIKLPAVTAVVTAFSLCLVAAIGAISFAYKKPFM